MVDPVIQRYRLQMEGVDAFQAADVVAVLVGERAALMMCVDAAVRTEVVPGHLRVELVELQCFLALDDGDARERNRGDDCTLSATDGAVAPTGVDDAIRQVEFKDDGTAVAGKPMFRQYRDTTDRLDHACVG